MGPAPNTYGPQQQSPQPTLAPNENPPAERSTLKEPINGSMESAPSSENTDPGDENSAGYLEAPQLFNPSDRTAQHTAAPVWNAIYHKSASAEGQQQLDADATGWTSVSN
jgi:hypothetical protein